MRWPTVSRKPKRSMHTRHADRLLVFMRILRREPRNRLPVQRIDFCKSCAFDENPQPRIEIDFPSPVRRLYYYKGSKSIGSIRTRADNVVPGPRRQTGASTCWFEECSSELIVRFFLLNCLLCHETFVAAQWDFIVLNTVVWKVSQLSKKYCTCGAADQVKQQCFNGSASAVGCFLLISVEVILGLTCHVPVGFHRVKYNSVEGFTALEKGL